MVLKKNGKLDPKQLTENPSAKSMVVHFENEDEACDCQTSGVFKTPTEVDEILPYQSPDTRTMLERLKNGTLQKLVLADIIRNGGTNVDSRTLDWVCSLPDPKTFIIQNVRNRKFGSRRRRGGSDSLKEGIEEGAEEGKKKSQDNQSVGKLSGTQIPPSAGGLTEEEAVHSSLLNESQTTPSAGGPNEEALIGESQVSHSASKTSGLQDPLSTSRKNSEHPEVNPSYNITSEFKVTPSDGNSDSSQTSSKTKTFNVKITFTVDDDGNGITDLKAVAQDKSTGKYPDEANSQNTKRQLQDNKAGSSASKQAPSSATDITKKSDRWSGVSEGAAREFNKRMMECMQRIDQKKQELVDSGNLERSEKVKRFNECFQGLKEKIADLNKACPPSSAGHQRSCMPTRQQRQPQMPGKGQFPVMGAPPVGLPPGYMFFIATPIMPQQLSPRSQSAPRNLGNPPNTTMNQAQMPHCSNLPPQIPGQLMPPMPPMSPQQGKSGQRFCEPERAVYGRKQDYC